MQALIRGLMLALGCSAAFAERPDIVLVVMDTVRRDHLSLYGYPRDTSPALRALAAESRVFDGARSVSSWTAPAHASLFTGLYPVAHRTTQESWHLPETAHTLAERLSAAGYTTLGIVENVVLREANGFHQGFESWDQIWADPRGEISGTRTLERLSTLLGELDPVQPLFLFINLNGAHGPYDSSGDHRDIFLSDPSISLDGPNRIAFYEGRRRYSAAELRHMGELYDAEIRRVDQTVGAIADRLRERRRWDRCAFIVTSDHGENLGDHGHVGHVFSLYESTLRIPLLIRHPPRFEPGSRDSTPVQLLDLFPTILHLAGLDAPSQGIDLAAGPAAAERVSLCEYYRPVQALRAHGPEPRHPALARHDRRIRALVRGDQKLIWGADGRHQLYDLALDPLELRDLAALDSKRDLLSELIGTLERTLATHRGAALPATDTPDSHPDPAAAEALRTLGYLP